MLFNARVQHLPNHPSVGHLLRRRGRFQSVPLLRMRSVILEVLTLIDENGLPGRNVVLIGGADSRLDRRGLRHVIE